MTKHTKANIKMGTLGTIALLLILFCGNVIGTVVAWVYFTPVVTVSCNCGGYSQQGFAWPQPPVEVNPKNRTDL